MDKKTKIFLGAILIVGVLIRGFNILHDMPMLNIGDEQGSGIFGALNMIVYKTIFIPDGSYINYPGLTSYIYLPFVVVLSAIKLLAVGDIEGLKNAVLLDNAASFMIIGRIVSIISAIITTIFVFKITEKYIGKKYAILASMLVNFNILFIIETLIGRPWGIAVMFLTVGLYYFLNIKRGEEVNGLLITGVMCGLSYASHQVGIFFFVIILLASIIKYKSKCKWILPGFVGMGLIITLLNPQMIGRHMELFEGTLDGENISYFGVSVFERIYFYIQGLFRYLPIETVVVVISFFAGFFKDKISKTILLLVLLYYIIIGPILGTNITRYLTPLAVLMGILAVKGVKEIKTKNNLIGNTVIGLLIVGIAWNTVFFSVAMARPSTYEMARQWVIENTEASDWIIISQEDLGLKKSKAALELIRDEATDFYLRREDSIMKMYEEGMTEENSYNYINLFMFKTEDVEDIAEITDSLSGYMVLIDQELEGAAPEASFTFSDKIEKWEPMLDNHWYKTFAFTYLYSIDRTGPTINIYKLN